MYLETLDRLIAEELKAMAPFDQGDAFRHEALEFDRSDLRAVLLARALLLRLFVVIELAPNAVYRTMEQIDGRPEEIAQVRLESRVAQGRNEGIEDVGHGAGDELALGKRPRIGLIVEGAIAEKL
ncbi:hypothetical protein J2R91_010100 [Bradyrhizobium japonicum]|nr:hypothetical protein [Bradyrhizobium japonicum]MCP1964121.1 hypothetical protein [Bradyrhizobium japonicum]